MTEEATILIVDDNVNLREMMSLVLKRKGYAAATAGDGLEAVEKAKEKPFDLIFMDSKMPVMDGVEALRRIIQTRPETVVMMMTGFAVADLVQEALEQGAYGIMYKPLDMDNVVAVTQDVTEARDTPGDPVSPSRRQEGRE